MSAPLQPATLEELAEAVRSAPRVIPVGGRTKPRLSVAPGAVEISTARLQRLVDYDPSEFTFTAEGGAKLADIGEMLAKCGQHLPFDLALARSGATLGGTVAAGLSGPGRQRYGGVRDFILGVRFADGAGRLLRMGGKVVKNAAGFDLPKFFVGSLGRFGILGEITFKVFPRPHSVLTLEIPVTGPAAMAELFAALARGRWEFEALEAPLPGGPVLARLGGPAAALPALAAEVSQRWSARVVDPAAAAALWLEANEFSWAHPAGPLCKIPLGLAGLPAFAALVEQLPGARGWVSAAGNGGYLSLADSGQLAAASQALTRLGWRGLVLRGTGPLWLGVPAAGAIYGAVKQALDPERRFPPLD